MRWTRRLIEDLGKHCTGALVPYDKMSPEFRLKLALRYRASAEKAATVAELFPYTPGECRAETES